MTAVSLSFSSLEDVNSIDPLRPEIAASREFQFFDLCLYPEYPTVSIDWVLFMTSAVAVKRSENRNVSWRTRRSTPIAWWHSIVRSVPFLFKVTPDMCATIRYRR
jgi:hypothetical protein